MILCLWILTLQLTPGTRYLWQFLQNLFLSEEGILILYFIAILLAIFIYLSEILLSSLNISLACWNRNFMRFSAIFCCCIGFLLYVFGIFVKCRENRRFSGF